MKTSLFFPFLSSPPPFPFPFPFPCSPFFPPFSFFPGWALLRLYGIKCAKCSVGFSKNDFVMRARAKVYHIECFRCVACSRQLIPGDEFALREDGLFCRADHDVVERASLGAGDPLSPLQYRPHLVPWEPAGVRRWPARLLAGGSRRLQRVPHPHGKAARACAPSERQRRRAPLPGLPRVRLLGEMPAYAVRVRRRHLRRELRRAAPPTSLHTSCSDQTPRVGAPPEPGAGGRLSRRRTNQCTE